jgi:hypothetical protein
VNMLCVHVQMTDGFLSYKRQARSQCCAVKAPSNELARHYSLNSHPFTLASRSGFSSTQVVNISNTRSRHTAYRDVSNFSPNVSVPSNNLTFHHRPQHTRKSSTYLRKHNLTADELNAFDCCTSAASLGCPDVSLVTTSFLSNRLSTSNFDPTLSSLGYIHSTKKSYINIYTYKQTS